MGTLVKTARKFRIESDSQGNNRFIIAAESDYWEVDKDKTIPIVPQVLYQTGFHLSKENVFVLNKKGGMPLNVNESVPQKFLTSVDRYLAIGSSYTEVNKEKYPITEIANRTEPVVAAKLATLFLAIDDVVLSSKNKSVIQELFVSPFTPTEGTPKDNRLILLKEHVGKFLASLTFQMVDVASVSETNVDPALPSSSVMKEEVQSPWERNNPFVI